MKNKKIPNLIPTRTEPIKCVWGLLCSLSSTDQLTNNISLFNIIEQFTLPAVYFRKQKSEEETLIFHYAYEVILNWRRALSLEISNEEISADLKFKIIGPNEEILQETIAPLKFPQGKKNVRFRIPMPGLVANLPGSYIGRVEVKFKDEKEFKQSLDIPFEVTEAK